MRRVRHLTGHTTLRRWIFHSACDNFDKQPDLCTCADTLQPQP